MRRKETPEEKAARIALEIEQMRHLLTLASFRALLWRFFSEARMFHTTFQSEKPDESAFREGKRAMALKLFNEVTTADPQAWAQLVAEFAPIPQEQPRD